MRTMTLAFAAAGFLIPAMPLMPLAAQDTTVTVTRNNAQQECTVRVDGRTLPTAEAEPICARMQERSFMMRLRSDSMRELAEEMASRTRKFGIRTDSAMRLAQRELARVQDEMAAERGRNLFAPLLMASRQSRPIIGVSVDPAPRETDRYGAYITAVSPGLPADKAGLRSGDIITRVAGKEIGTTERPRDGASQSLVSIRLIEAVGALEAGKEVRIDYRRDGSQRSAMIAPIEDRNLVTLRAMEPQEERLSTIIARPSVSVVRPSAPGAPPAPSGEVRVWSSAPASGGFGAFSFATGALAKMELAPMNAKLGSYFGVSNGVLVVNVPSEGNMGLQPGDVVTAVDGRRVETPNELLRVLRTYDKDRSFTLQVTRQKRQESLTATLP